MGVRHRRCERSPAAQPRPPFVRRRSRRCPDVTDRVPALDEDERSVAPVAGPRRRWRSGPTVGSAARSARVRPVARPRRRMSSWMRRCPASAGSSCVSRASEAMSGRSSASPIRCHVSIDSAPAATTLDQADGGLRGRPRGRPSARWVRRRRTREARTSQPQVANEPLEVPPMRPGRQLRALHPTHLALILDGWTYVETVSPPFNVGRLATTDASQSVLDSHVARHDTARPRPLCATSGQSGRDRRDDGGVGSHYAGLDGAEQPPARARRGRPLGPMRAVFGRPLGGGPRAERLHCATR